MLVTTANLDSIVSKLKGQSKIGFDTETYGLKWNDRLFSMIFYTPETGGFYFNFLEKDEDHLPYTILPDLQAELFNDTDKLWYMHNAPYDVRRLSIEECSLRGRIHCTQSNARLVHNTHMAYSLDACLKRDLQMEKDDAVAAYIKEHKCWTVDETAITKAKPKNKHFDQVPLEILIEYGIRDAEGTYKLGEFQREKIAEYPMNIKDKSTGLYQNELKLTKALCEIAETGIKIDKKYCEKGFEYEWNKAEEKQAELSQLCDEEFKSGPLWLARQFDKFGYKYQINPTTGNPVFNKYAMEAMDNPIANKIKEIRHHENYARNFYNSFLTFADDNNIVHADIKQGGTDTGRFSCANPNMQNVPKEEDYEGLEFIVRRAFIPREGFCFVAIDYDQQEFRLMLDYAGERRLIKRIVEEGLDVHEATAQMMNATRKQAKTLNFGLLYGMGVEKLAVALNCAVAEAANLKARYFDNLPMVERLVYKVKDKARVKRAIYTWAGRQLKFTDPRLSYKAPNHLIQGGCGDIMRYAIVQGNEILRPYKSRILMTVHDELLLEVHESEYDIIPDVKQMMESIYTGANGMILTCGVEHSYKSFAQADMLEGEPK